MLLYNNNTLLTELNKFVEIWNAARIALSKLCTLLNKCKIHKFSKYFLSS